MEIFKKILLLIFVIIILFAVIAGLSALFASGTSGIFGTSNTDNVSNPKWYDSAYHLNEYYVADSGSGYDTGTGYEYYLADSKNSSGANASGVISAGSMYYESDYETYSGEIFTQFEDSNTGYEYYKEFNEDSWNPYSLNN